jgi:hypothetical protein
MNTAKRTYALPSNTLQRFEREIAPGKRSAKVAELIELWIADRERDAIRGAIVEGCREMNEIYLANAGAWEDADDELWRGIDG